MCCFPFSCDILFHATNHSSNMQRFIFHLFMLWYNYHAPLRSCLSEAYLLKIITATCSNLFFYKKLVIKYRYNICKCSCWLNPISQVFGTNNKIISVTDEKMCSYVLFTRSFQEVTKFIYIFSELSKNNLTT